MVAINGWLLSGVTGAEGGLFTARLKRRPPASSRLSHRSAPAHPTDPPGVPAYIFLFIQSLQHEVEGTAVRVQLVLPGAVISEGWEVAGGGALEALPESIVMTTEDCVDAALAGLDLGETITAPSLHDAGLLGDYVALSGKMLQSVFDARPAARYGVGMAAE